MTPRIIVRDVAAQVDFLREVFGGTGEVHAGRPAEILVGDSIVMVSPATDRDRFPAFLYVYVDDADEVYRRAVDAGAESMEPPVDVPYGDRRAMVRDPFGNVFQIAHQRSSPRGWGSHVGAGLEERPDVLHHEFRLFATGRSGPPRA